jgi:hypothetical protein
METSTNQESAKPKLATPQKEHRWLQKMIGDWSYEVEATAVPGQPAETSTGTESVHSLGGLWVVCAGRGEMAGIGMAYTQMTLGYDTEKKRFVGSWVGSMMTQQWVYEGTLDEARKTLTLESEGPSMKEDGSRALYRDTIRFESDDHRVLTSHVRGDDGQWQAFMTAHYRRK